eukprot:6084291-Prorocentrum_lima.AAC.1
MLPLVPFPWGRRRCSFNASLGDAMFAGKDEDDRAFITKVVHVVVEGGPLGARAKQRSMRARGRQDYAA